MPDRDRDLRASDADRDRVAAELREHAASGRLSFDELGERLETVFAARTLGELAAPLVDLPRAEREQHQSLLVGVPMLLLAALLLTAWVLSGAGGLWPVWVLLGLWWFGPLRHRHRWAHGRRSFP